jgi:ubiquinone/menaquinone biosynthesis C-methylase UbiE
VETLAVRAGDRLLEIGCGRGSAAWLVCSRLGRRGRLLAIDRSPAAVKAAEQRNREHIASGRAEFRVAALDALRVGRRRFDKAYAINVNMFWVRSSTVEIGVIAGALRPGGSLYLFYEAPDPARTHAIAERVGSVLSGHGWDATTSSILTRRSTAVICLRATRPS